MDFFAGTDVARARSQGKDKAPQIVGLPITNALAHEYAGPLFRAGVAHMYLTRRSDYTSRVSAGRPHSIIVLMEGQLAVTLNRRKRILHPGMICVRPTGTPWSRKTLTPSASWIAFNIDPEPLWRPLEARTACTRKYEFANIMHSLVTRVLQAYHSDDVSEKYVAQSLSHAILELLKYELTTMDSLPSKHAGTVEELFDRVQANPEENWTVERMVAETGMPARSLTRHCHRVYGSPPLELVIRQRLRLACKLLGRPEAKESLEDIASQVGYTSAASFSTVFNRHMGMRPGEFRKRQRGGKK